MTPVLALSASISDLGFSILDCEGIITDGKAMDDLRFTRRRSWFCFEGHA